jgi:hypothetical protein
MAGPKHALLASRRSSPGDDCVKPEVIRQERLEGMGVSLAQRQIEAHAWHLCDAVGIGRG